MTLFPYPYTQNVHKVLQVGDVTLTYGKVRLPEDLWPPWDAVGKGIVYGEIRRFQKNLGYEEWGATHCRVVTGAHELWEMTAPRGQFLGFDILKGKKVLVCRPKHPLNLENLRPACEEMLKIEPRYDYLELVSFKLSQLFGVKKRILRFDRGLRWVCSTGIANGLTKCGQTWLEGLDWKDIPPAYYGTVDDFAKYRIPKAIA